MRDKTGHTLSKFGIQCQKEKEKKENNKEKQDRQKAIEGRKKERKKQNRRKEQGEKSGLLADPLFFFFFLLFFQLDELRVPYLALLCFVLPCRLPLRVSLSFLLPLVRLLRHKPTCSKTRIWTKGKRESRKVK